MITLIELIEAAIVEEYGEANSVMLAESNDYTQGFLRGVKRLANRIEDIMGDWQEQNTNLPTLTVSGYLCPKSGCGRLMQNVGVIETVDTHDRKPLDPRKFDDMYGCPEHGGRYMVNGYFLTDVDAIPE